MGTILSSLTSHRSDVFMGVSTLSLISYLIWSSRSKTKMRETLLNDKLPLLEDIKQQIHQDDIHQGHQQPIYKIAITGGPCAGKSTSMSKVHKVFSQRGYRVFSVPEVPTMVVLSGGMILMSKFNAQERIKFQSLLIRFQMYLEDYITKLASMSKMKSIILCDRGTMDPQAYISKEQFQSVLDEEGWSKVVLRDRRYDRVIFLSSAANGAEKYYTLENNVARSEGIEQARILDKKTLEAWVGHPHLTICPNLQGKTFEDKINRVIQAVHKTVGFQVPNARQSKILIQKPKYPPGLHIERGERIDIFLKNQNEQIDEDKLTQWGQNSSYCYQRKFRFKKQNDSDYSKQIRKSLTSTQFVMLCDQKDPKRNPVKYQRVKFAENNIYYTVDKLTINGTEQYILRYFSLGADNMEMVPQWMDVKRDVTKERQYKVKYISLKQN